MTRLTALLKQLFVVTAFFVAASASSIELEEFLSPITGVQEEAIARLDDLSVAQRNQLNKLVMQETFRGRPQVIIALLQKRHPARIDLIHRLLHQGAPSETIPALVSAMSDTMTVTGQIPRLEAAIVGPSVEKATIAAYSLSLITRSKRDPKHIEAFYRKFATSEIPPANLRSILTNMNHWEEIPRANMLEPFLRHLCEPDAGGDLRFEAAVLRIKLYGVHEGVEMILQPVAESSESELTQVQSIAKSLLATPSLSDADIRMLISLQENPKTPNYLRGALSWRLLRHRRLSGATSHLDPRWQSMLGLLDDQDLDEEVAGVLLSDLTAYIGANRTQLTPLKEIGAPVKTEQGRALFARLEEMSSAVSCSNDVAHPITSAIPPRFLQAILL